MDDSPEPDETPTRLTGEEAPPQVIRSADILRDTDEVWIDHNGERYRLRVTRKGKLILQK